MSPNARLPPVIVGTINGIMCVLQSDGSSATFINGKWQPGIAFATKDFQDMPVIENVEAVAKILNEASEALAKSLEQ
jgi:hypothetical protein